MILGPFHAVAHCTFCGTSDLYCYPAPRKANEAYFTRTGRPVPDTCCHFETHPTFCPTCCGLQEDGHEFEYEHGDGHRCIRCDEVPPNDWHGYQFDD